MKKINNKISVNLLDLIKERNKKMIEQADGMQVGELSELHLHKILFIVYGQFYVKFKRELFNCEFQAWKYSPVEMRLRELLNKNKKENKKFFDVELNDKEEIYIIKVIDKFLRVSPWALVDFTHSMDAWMFNYNDEDKEHNKLIPKEEIISSIKEKNILII